MCPLAVLCGYCVVCTHAMYTEAFLQAFNSLGLMQWEGIELDIAWGHVTSLLGLPRPSVDGPIFVYRAPCQSGVRAPSRARVMTTITSGPDPILADIVAHFEDLADPGRSEPWRLLPLDTTRGRSRNREMHYPCYILVDFGAFRYFGLRPHGLLEVILGQTEISFPTVLPMAVNVVILGDFLAPLLHTGLPGLRWRAWLNGDLLGFPLVPCQEGFFLQVQVWGGATLMQNMVVAAPLLVGLLHLDMDVLPDASFARVTTYIPGGNTLMSSRVLTVTTVRTGMELFLHSELRRRFIDLRLVNFRVIPVHPAATWNEPVLVSGREKMVLVYEEEMLQLDAAAFLRLHLPPFFGEGAIYCPRRLRKKDLIDQLGLLVPCAGNGDDCICYVNSHELSNERASEVDDGDFIWCLHAPPEETQSGEVLSVATHSDTSVEEVVGQAVSSLETPQGLIGAAHYCSRV